MLLDFLSQNSHWIFTGILFLPFFVFAGVNFVYLLCKIASGFEDGPSFAPLFGGLFGVMAVLFMPVGEVTERLAWCWVPLLLDAGCIPMFVLIPLYARFRKRRRSE